MTLTKPELRLLQSVTARAFPGAGLTPGEMRAKISEHQQDLVKIRQALRRREDDVTALNRAKQKLEYVITKLTQRLPRPEKSGGET